MSFNLSGTQAGVLYQLYFDNPSGPDVPIGIAILGGSGAIIGTPYPYDAGTYYYLATTIAGGCTRVMSQPRTVTIVDPPAVFNVTGGGGVCSGGPGVPIGLDGSQPGVTYRLKRIVGMSTTTVSTVVGNGNAIPFGYNYTIPGTYIVMASNAGCMVNMNGNAVITTLPSPTAYPVSGGGTYCLGGAGVPV